MKRRMPRNGRSGARFPRLPPALGWPGALRPRRTLAPRGVLMRRGALAALLIGVVVFPGVSARVASRPCRAGGCPVGGLVRWSRSLTGSWIAQNGIEGTVPGQGQAFAAVGGGVAAVGFGLEVGAFAAGTGIPLWETTLSGLRPGSAIASVRAWPGVITVGVAVPAGSGAAPRAAAPRAAAPREEVVLNAVTGRQVRAYPAAPDGGAVSASAGRTVIVGQSSVTSYRNATGAVAWRVRTGAAGQAWRADGPWLYVTVSAHGVIGTAPVTAVRRIGLRTGSQRLIRPRRRSFDGMLSAAVDGVLWFSGSRGLSLYSAATGRLIARRPGAVPEGVDPVRQILYADVPGALVGIDPATGMDEPGTRVPGPPATYGVRDGVALGLDPGAAGAAWGYSVATKRVIWTTRSLPWPHYFVDQSGLGGSVGADQGSADQGSAGQGSAGQGGGQGGAALGGTIALLVTCAKTGQLVPGGSQAGSGLACLRPMLVAIDR